MIYTVISGIEKIQIEQNRYCRIVGQPLSLLPEEVNEFICNTKNESLRAERRLAYTTLLCSLKVFFGIDNLTIAKNSYGKPYLIYKTEKYQKNEDCQLDEVTHQKNKDLIKENYLNECKSQEKSQIYISISHSDGAVAVSLSDEGEIGVDIQSAIFSDRAERLKERFFDGLTVEGENIKVNYYFCSMTENKAVLSEIYPEPFKNDFTAKWAYAESIMKLYGRGFGDIKEISSLAHNSMTDIRCLPDGFVVATSIKS